MVEQLAECAVCGEELDRKPGPGRPPRYCGETCRRTREFEIRRAVRQVERAEIEEQKARYDAETRDCIYPERAAQRRDWWAFEVDRLGKRLQGLLH